MILQQRSGIIRSETAMGKLANAVGNNARMTSKIGRAGRPHSRELDSQR